MIYLIIVLYLVKVIIMTVMFCRQELQ